MGRRRKSSPDVSWRSSRPRQALAPRHRVISVYKSASGRIGQTTSYIETTNTPSTSGQGAAAIPPPSGLAVSVSDAELLPAHTDLPHFPMDDDGPEFEGDMDTDPTTTHKSSPLLDWAANYRDCYADELLRHDGRAGSDQCAECAGNGILKCKDCFGCQLLCTDCFVSRYAHLPFHRALVRLLSITFGVADTSDVMPAMDRDALCRCIAQVPWCQALPRSRWKGMWNSWRTGGEFHCR